jgi:hypothetical protein
VEPEVEGKVMRKDGEFWIIEGLLNESTSFVAYKFSSSDAAPSLPNSPLSRARQPLNQSLNRSLSLDTSLNDSPHLYGDSELDNAREVVDADKDYDPDLENAIIKVDTTE